MSAAGTEVGSGHFDLSAAERRRRILIGLVALALLGGVAMLALPAPNGGSVAAVHLAQDAQQFEAVLTASWRQQEGTRLCGPFVRSTYAEDGASFMQLRCNLFADSLLFVPGYAGLLVFFMLGLAAAIGIRNALWVHVWCLLPVAVAFFDIAENAMTAQAASDLLGQVLADATVRDVRLASVIKWWLVAGSFAVLSALAWLARSKGLAGRWLDAGAVLAGVTALLIAAGAAFAPAALAGGMATAALALTAFVVRDFRESKQIVRAGGPQGRR